MPCCFVTGATALKPEIRPIFYRTTSMFSPLELRMCVEDNRNARLKPNLLLGIAGHAAKHGGSIPQMYPHAEPTLPGIGFILLKHKSLDDGRFQTFGEGRHSPLKHRQITSKYVHTHKHTHLKNCKPLTPAAPIIIKGEWCQDTAKEWVTAGQSSFYF